MTKLQKTGIKNPRKNKISNPKPMVTDFGIRKVSQQNFSKIVALPKMALDNCGITTEVNVKLVQFDGEKFIELIPVKSKGGENK